MSQQFNRTPTYAEPIVTKGSISKSWYSFFSGLGSGLSFGLPSTVTPTGSPFSYKATEGGTLIIQGGSVSMVSFTRDGLSNFNTGQTQGMFPVSQGDTLIITYSAAPNLTFVPR
jgi:trimeric autotransporter adhesin